MRFLVCGALVAVLLVACGGASSDSAADPPAPGSGTTATSLARSETPPSQDTTTLSPVPEVGEIDLVTYVATIEDLLAGTAYEGRALEAPEVFLATGALFCDQLDAGVSSDEVLTRYIENLTGGSVDDAANDDLTMAGAVLGTGLVTLCPQHIASLGAS